MARRAPALITSSNAKRWIDGFDNCLIDCDGVLWKGEERVEGAAAALEALATKHNKSLYFVTNNASKSRLDLIDKLAKFGIFNIRESQVITSASACAAYLKSTGFSRKVYMVGEAGLKNELANAGIEAEGLEDARLGYSPGSITQASLNPDIGAVVVGLDRNLCYYKVSKAVAYIKYGKDVKFVSTNPDGSFPDGDVAIAGGGSIGAMIAYAAGRAPDAVTGKPGKMMMDMALAMNGLSRERTIMIGDRLDTDIAFGIAGGLQSTLHVLTGVNSLEDSNNADDSMKPDYYTPSLGHLVDLL